MASIVESVCWLLAIIVFCAFCLLMFNPEALIGFIKVLRKPKDGGKV